MPRLKVSELPSRCSSCAFRAGPQVANGSPATLMKSVQRGVEGHEFLCHEPTREGGDVFVPG